MPFSTLGVPPPNEVPVVHRVLTEPTAVATCAVERAMFVGMPNAGKGYGLGRTVVQGRCLHRAADRGSAQIHRCGVKRHHQPDGEPTGHGPAAGADRLWFG